MRADGTHRPRVLLGVDHKWRDLPTYACLHRLLETKYGMDVTVIRRTWEKSYLSWVRPDIVVFEALFYPWVQELARELHELGVKIVILPTEGAPIDQPNKLQLAGKGVDYSVVDLFVSWNEEIRDRIVESGALTPEKVEVAGCPRFDFYRLPLDRLVMGRDEFSRKYRLPPNRATITFASGFVLAGMATRNREFLKQDWQALQKNQTGVGWYDDPYAMAHAELKTRELFLEALQKLHAERPDWNFILRPHPGEDQVVYSEFAKKKFSDGRVRVVPSEYIWNVLRSTDVLVARASTTAVEAWLAGKPSVEFQLNPVDFSKNYVSEYEPGSIPARSYEELRGAIDRCLASPDPDPARRSAREEIIKKYFYRVDGLCAERFARRLRTLADEVTPDPAREWALARRYSGQVVRLAVRLMKSFFRSEIIRNLVGGGSTWDYMGRFDRFIYPQDIMRWARIIRASRVL